VYWKWCERKFSRPIWDNICIATDQKGCCHDLIWGAIWIGTDVKECCHDLIWSAMWIGKDVTGSYHDKFDVICGLEQMLTMLSWPNSRCSFDWKRCGWKLSRPIWGTIWIESDVKWCCHDLICGVMCIGKIWMEDIKNNLRHNVDWKRG
jgi:hypothetical protein